MFAPGEYVTNDQISSVSPAVHRVHRHLFSQERNYSADDATRQWGRGSFRLGKLVTPPGTRQTIGDHGSPWDYPLWITMGIWDPIYPWELMIHHSEWINYGIMIQFIH